MLKPSTGILLIADPFLKDPNFMRTVVLICRHNDEEGTFGFTLNKMYHQTLDELIPELAGFELPIYLGGPVQIDTLHYLHQYHELLPDSQKVTEDVYWGGDFETLKILIKNKEIDLQKIKFFLGYSGWSKGQLNDEIEEKTWLTVKGNSKIIIETAP
ncbi:MAG: YqgE/AlgH family protein, partial [Ferruginibacter sp.]